MLIAHKITLKLNHVEAAYMAKAAGTARFAYNWALAQWTQQYAAWKTNNDLKKPSEGALRRQLNTIKREQFPWMLEVTKCAPQLAIMQLGQAFKNFFDGRTKYPKFRKKGVHDRFSLSNDQFSIKNDGRHSRIRIPNLGWVRMREGLRLKGKIVSATVSRVADKWFVSIAVDTLEESTLPKAQNQGTAGVDLGVSTLAALSTGEKIAGNKPLNTLLLRLKRLSRSLSRKVKGSASRNKAKHKLARLHARISNIRRDQLHKLTTDLTSRFHTIGIEDLNVKGMTQNRHLARSVADMGFYEFRRQLTYKAQWRGGQIVVADRWFASSKTCSVCGYKLDKLPLSMREWDCHNCNTHHDRDVNAAINLRNYAVSSTVSACGEGGSGSGCKTRTKPSSVKQEASSRFTHL